MAQFLLLTTLLTLAGLVSTIIAGYIAAPGAGVARHILLAIGTMLVGLFSQSMTMFFFIGTGKEIKEKARNAEDAAGVARQTREFKSKVFPSAMYAMGLLMLTFILGGGVLTGKVAKWIHQLTAIGTLVLYARAYWIELSAMDRNARLMERFLAESDEGPT